MPIGENYLPRSGELIRSDDSVANIASIFAPKPLNHEAITISSTAVPLTAAELAGAVTALITVEGASIRYRLDGTAPTASVGTLLNAGDVRFLTSPEQIAGFQAIATGADATIMVEYGV